MALNSFFLVDAILRISGLYIFAKIEHAFHRQINFQETFRKSGFLDIVLVFLCYNIYSEVGLWIRLLRLMQVTTAVLAVFPHIDVLMVSHPAVGLLINLICIYTPFLIL